MTTVSADSASSGYLVWLISKVSISFSVDPGPLSLNCLAVLAAEIFRDRLRHRTGSIIAYERKSCTITTASLEGHMASHSDILEVATYQLRRKLTSLPFHASGSVCCSDRKAGHPESPSPARSFSAAWHDSTGRITHIRCLLDSQERPRQSVDPGASPEMSLPLQARSFHFALFSCALFLASWRQHAVTVA